MPGRYKRKPGDCNKETIEKNLQDAPRLGIKGAIQQIYGTLGHYATNFMENTQETWKTFMVCYYFEHFITFLLNRNTKKSSAVTMFFIKAY